MRGLIIRTTGQSYIALTAERQEVECIVKGNFRLRDIHSTNPVAVGDYVTLHKQADNQPFFITEIEDRRNYIIRRSTNLSKQSHIIASNIDQLALLITLHHPETSTTFIDRCLATAEAYRIPAMLIFNKIDLLSDTSELTAMINLYRGIGYECLAISALRLGDDKQSLTALLRGKRTLLSGNSGVGKSTLLNALLGADYARTAPISEVHDTGMHTTTFSQMYPMSDADDTWIIDTPGIKGFGSYDMTKEEMSHYFRDIFSLSADCRFYNCTHTHEPGCAVGKALQQGTLAPSRYNSYLNMLQDIDETKYR